MQVGFSWNEYNEEKDSAWKEVAKSQRMNPTSLICELCCKSGAYDLSNEERRSKKPNFEISRAPKIKVLDPVIKTYRTIIVDNVTIAFTIGRKIELRLTGINVLAFKRNSTLHTVVVLHQE